MSCEFPYPTHYIIEHITKISYLIGNIIQVVVHTTLQGYKGCRIECEIPLERRLNTMRREKS